ncbi:hypothetical protein [Streptomyces adustus]
MRRPANPWSRTSCRSPSRKAEVLDLMEARPLVFHGDRNLPSAPSPADDRLPAEDAASPVRQVAVRAGRGPAVVPGPLVVLDLERIGLTARARGRRIPPWAGRTEPAESAARRRAGKRRAAGEGVLAAPAFAAGIGDGPADGP